MVRFFELPDMAFHLSLSLPRLPCARQDTRALHARLGSADVDVAGHGSLFLLPASALHRRLVSVAL
jgi:hypothetical protein